MLGVHVMLQVLEVSVLLFADVTDAQPLLVLLEHFPQGGVEDNTLVPVELLQPSKALAADVTQVGAFTGVSPHVLLQRRCVDELLGAHVTAVWRRFATVAQHVRLHVPVLFKLSLANQTGKWSISGVFRHVFTQPIGTCIGPATKFTTVGAFPGMTAKMLFQVAPLGEGFRADVACKQPLISMRTHMPFQVRSIRKLL